MKESQIVKAAVVVALLLGAAAWYFWPRPAPPQPEVVQPVPRAISEAPIPGEPEPPAVQHPVEAIEPPAPAPRKPLPALAKSDDYVKSELLDLLGQKNVLTFLQLDGFVRRVVATVDNLAREHAPASTWPVNPTSGRFTTMARGEGTVINPDNEHRYTAFVMFVESVNMQKAVQLYVSLYPLFQQAYQDLGYPKRYFNDRLVAVIDHLLAAPVRDGLMPVTLVEVKGPIPSERPWVRYEFADEKLEAMSAGQKILMRTGPANHRRLRAKLQEIRKLVTKAELPTANKQK